jgi:hypothetical protein
MNSYEKQKFIKFCEHLGKIRGDEMLEEFRDQMAYEPYLPYYLIEKIDLQDINN